MTTMTMATDRVIRALATPNATADVFPCGCIATATDFFPCAACKAEVAAGLALEFAEPTE
jgi:hypothetical protein